MTLKFVFIYNFIFLNFFVIIIALLNYSFKETNYNVFFLEYKNKLLSNKHLTFK